MLVFIKRSIEKWVKIRKSLDEDSLEVTLKKDFFGLSKEQKFLVTYASPKISHIPSQELRIYWTKLKVNTSVMRITS